MTVASLVLYFVPNTKVRVGDVVPGAILTTLLWQANLRGFAWYASDISRYTQIHGSTAGVVVFLIWIYLSVVILLYGVEVTAACARLRDGQRAQGRTVTAHEKRTSPAQKDNFPF